MMFSNKVGEVMRTLTAPTFTYLEVPQGAVEEYKDRNKIYNKPNEMEVFALKRQWADINMLQNDYKNYQKMAYPLILGQCLPALRAQLEGTKELEVNAKQDVVEILQLIRGFCCHHDHNSEETYAVVTSFKSLLYFYQKPGTTNDKYLKEFKAWVWITLMHISLENSHA